MGIEITVMLYCLLCSVGAALIVVRGAIFAPLREMAEGRQFKAGPIDFDLAKLLSCPMCLGLWSGLFFGAAFWALGFAPFAIVMPAAFGTSLLAPLLDPIRGWS